MSSSNESYINKKIQRVVKCPMREIKYFSMVKQYLFLILTPIQIIYSVCSNTDFSVAHSSITAYLFPPIYI